MKRLTVLPASFMQVMSLFVLLCMWTACSAPRHASTRIPAVSASTYMVPSDNAPQAAQGYLASEEATRAEALLVSSDPAAVMATHQQIQTALKQLAAERPKAAHELEKLVTRVEAPSKITDGQAVPAAKVTKAKQLLRKVERKLESKQAKEANAAQANTTLVALGALLAIVGLVLALVTTGTASTIGIIALAAGVVILLVSILT